MASNSALGLNNFFCVILTIKADAASPKSFDGFPSVDNSSSFILWVFIPYHQSKIACQFVNQDVEIALGDV